MRENTDNPWEINTNMFCAEEGLTKPKHKSQTGGEPWVVWLAELLEDFIELCRSVETSSSLWSCMQLRFESHLMWKNLLFVCHSCPLTNITRKYGIEFRFETTVWPIRRHLFLRHYNKTYNKTYYKREL